MAAAKLIVMYPMPKDMAAFERAYSAEHIPMAAPIFQAAGATKAVLTKIIKAAVGTPRSIASPRSTSPRRKPCRRAQHRRQAVTPSRTRTRFRMAARPSS